MANQIVIAVATKEELDIVEAMLPDDSTSNVDGWELHKGNFEVARLEYPDGREVTLINCIPA